jgi:hypothetical protein
MNISLLHVPNVHVMEKLPINALVVYHFHLLVVWKRYCGTHMGFLLNCVFKLSNATYQNLLKRTGNFMHVLSLACKNVTFL